MIYKFGENFIGTDKMRNNFRAIKFVNFTILRQYI